MAKDCVLGLAPVKIYFIQEEEGLYVIARSIQEAIQLWRNYRAEQDDESYDNEDPDGITLIAESFLCDLEKYPVFSPTMPQHSDG